MTVSKQQRAIALNFHNALLILATDEGIEAARYAAGDSDESVKLLHVSTILAAFLNGQSDVEARRPSRDSRPALWLEELKRAERFAAELRTAMLADAECAPVVAALTAESAPQNLIERIAVVLMIADRELGAEIARIEAQHPDLKSFFDAERAAYVQCSALGFWGQDK